MELTSFLLAKRTAAYSPYMLFELLPDRWSAFKWSIRLIHKSSCSSDFWGAQEPPYLAWDEGQQVLFLHLPPGGPAGEECIAHWLFSPKKSHSLASDRSTLQCLEVGLLASVPWGGFPGMPCVNGLAPALGQWSHREVLGIFQALKVTWQSLLVTSSYIINLLPLLIHHSLSLWAFVPFNLTFQLLMCISSFPSQTTGFWRRGVKSDLTLYLPQNLVECWYRAGLTTYKPRKWIDK